MYINCSNTGTPKSTPKISLRKSISIEDQKSQEKLLIAVENDEDGDNQKTTWKTGGKVPMTLTETINNQKVSIDWHGKCSI